MKGKLLIILLALCVPYIYSQEAKNDIDFKEEDNRKDMEELSTYSFSVAYRIEAGYVQDWQNSRTDNYRETYFHGGRAGVTFDFNLPYNLSMQTGVLYSLTYGKNEQHVRNAFDEAGQIQVIEHNITKHNIVVPIRATYTQKIWRKLAMYFYAGPQLQFSVSQHDKIEASLNEQTRLWCEQQNLHLDSYDIIKDGEQHIFNIQLGVGGGLQWDKFRLYSGYDFGLNDLVKKSDKVAAEKRKMWEWGWFVSFAYTL